MTTARWHALVVFLLGLLLLGLWQGRCVWRPATQERARVPAAVFVGLQGAVPRPGIYAFPQPPTLTHLFQEGGLSTRPPWPELVVASGDQVEICEDGEVKIGLLPGWVCLTLGVPLDLNRAGIADLEAVPGLGPVLARRLVQYRQEHGPFHSLEQLLDLSGFGADKLEQIRPYLVLSKPTVTDRR